MPAKHGKFGPDTLAQAIEAAGVGLMHRNSPPA
jgi:hypothetical protein